MVVVVTDHFTTWKITCLKMLFVMCDKTPGIYVHFIKLCWRILVVLRELTIQLAVGDNTNRRQTTGKNSC